MSLFTADISNPESLQAYVDSAPTVIENIPYVPISLDEAVNTPIITNVFSSVDSHSQVNILDAIPSVPEIVNNNGVPKRIKVSQENINSLKDAYEKHQDEWSALQYSCHCGIKLSRTKKFLTDLRKGRCIDKSTVNKGRKRLLGRIQSNMLTNMIRNDCKVSLQTLSDNLANPDFNIQSEPQQELLSLEEERIREEIELENMVPVPSSNNNQLNDTTSISPIVQPPSSSLNQNTITDIPLINENTSIRVSPSTISRHLRFRMIDYDQPNITLKRVSHREINSNNPDAKQKRIETIVKLNDILNNGTIPLFRDETH
ncbi:hypothetical protein WA158_006904 [Blastocystis sp. Blastoise]